MKWNRNKLKGRDKYKKERKKKNRSEGKIMREKFKV